MFWHKRKNNLVAHPTPWRENLFHIIFGIKSKEGKLFDRILIWIIVLSIVIVMLDSVSLVHETYPSLLVNLEWIFTFIFTVEFILRILSLKNPMSYVFSLYGFVDLMAIFPSFFSYFFPGFQSLLVIRTLRLLRIFRVFKLNQYMKEAEMLIDALRNSKNKISVFIFTVLSLAVIMGALMYLLEGEENGFTSIPKGMYWAIVTMTTVGYGDIAPKTIFGQILASLLMIMGYGIIAVPTGIFSNELVKISGKKQNEISCNRCELAQHDHDAVYCKRCGKKLATPR